MKYQNLNRWVLCLAFLCIQQLSIANGSPFTTIQLSSSSSAGAAWTGDCQQTNCMSGFGICHPPSDTITLNTIDQCDILFLGGTWDRSITITSTQTFPVFIYLT